MSKLNRRLILILFASVFLILALVIILYALGYRYSFENRSIERTGALFIVPSPSQDTNIFVNGGLITRRSIFRKNAFVQSLTPGTYEIVVSRDGFKQWKKNVIVYAEVVTDVNPILLPESINPYTVKIEGTFTDIEVASDKVIKATKEADEVAYIDVDTLAELVNFSDIVNIDAEPLNESIISFRELVAADGVSIDTNESRALYWSSKSAGIRWLRSDDKPYYLATSTIELITSPHSIRQGAFYPGKEAVILSSGFEIFIVEIDGRNGHAVTSLYRGKEPKFIMPDKNKRTIFVLDDNNIFFKATLP